MNIVKYFQFCDFILEKTKISAFFYTCYKNCQDIRGNQASAYSIFKQSTSGLPDMDYLNYDYISLCHSLSRNHH